MIKLNFCDMPLSFDKNNNFLTDILRRHQVEYIISDTPDFLLYSCYGSKNREVRNCVKIFWTPEPVAPDFNRCDYAVGYDPITFSDRYCKRPYWLFEQQPDRSRIDDEAALNRRFCNFIYSNDQNGEGAVLRKKLAQNLMQYKHVDCPGRVLNNMTDAISPREGNWRAGKLDFIKDYKFTIAFENTAYPGYTTEKLMEPYQANSIPIYWGNPEVLRDFNGDSMINCSGRSMEEIIDRIKTLDNDDELYLKMLHEPPMNPTFTDNEVETLERFFLNIFAKGNAPYLKDPLDYLPKMEPQNMSTLQRIRKKLPF